jgi:rSAM/selenodomain-associated transferase 2
MKFSIIIPVLNEAMLIAETLSALQPFRFAGNELIVVDGGSTDATIALSRPFSDQIITGLRGRSRQMNAGAYTAKGDILIFLHADTFLPKGADQAILAGMRSQRKNWGRFDIRLSGRHPLLRTIELLMNWRSRLSGIATGDQAIFVRRELFKAVGGFPDIDLMEDIALSKLLKRYGAPLCLWQKAFTSSRRWEKNGILRTIFLMWGLRLAYFGGVNPAVLARWYRSQKEP